MKTRDWDAKDRFTSSSGKMVCRILCWDKDGVHCERWTEKNPRRRTRFTLTERFWLSKSCGWTLTPRSDEREV